MQTLIDKNDALREEITRLEEKITKLKAEPPVNKKLKPKKGNYKKKQTGRRKSLVNTLRGMIGLGDDAAKKNNPKRIEQVHKIHELLLEENYEQVDEIMLEHSKILVGKKKGEEQPTAFSLVDENGETVLMKAIKEGKTELGLGWIEKGTVDVNAVDSEGMTPLMVAAMFGDTVITTTLVKKASKDVKTLYSKQTAMHYAAVEGNLEIVQILLDNGCDCTLEDVEGLKPFQVTADCEVRDVLKEAMRKVGKPATAEEEEFERAEEKAPEEEGREVRTYSQDEQMKPLLKENQDLIAKRKRLILFHDDLVKKRSPKNKFYKLINLDPKAKKEFLGLQKAALDEDVQKLHELVARGGDDNAVDQVEVLLTDKNIDINSPDEFGETALMKAARLGFELMLTLLLHYKCNTEIKDVEGYTALMKAAQFGKEVCVEKLIAEGSDLNATSRTHKNTALMLAAERGHADVCELLISRKADHGMRNSENKTAVELCKNDEARERILAAMEKYPVHRPPVQL